VSFDLADYDFDLPDALIAQEAAEPRDAARLLVAAGLHDRIVADLPEVLPEGALLVVNDTRVVPARLLARKDTGGQVELLLTRPFARPEPDLLGHEALYRSSKALRVGQRLALGSAHAQVTAVQPGGVCTVDFGGVADLRTLLEREGHVPLPPYIRGGRDGAPDHARYQCTYARQPGAVAAPTAGLHLTPALLERLALAAIERVAVTLHVGPGTFLPVRATDLRDHRVLPERFEVSEATAARLQEARSSGRPIVAVGTTTVRTLETLALRCGDGPLQGATGDAELTIVPGHRFRLPTHLLTNFHLPRSSLLVLVSTFAGRRPVLDAYRHAVASGYRFYSYGDAMLLERAAD
jgi:S-adenosylmethionine:tRNA ribosyltransferase-isomerase